MPTRTYLCAYGGVLRRCSVAPAWHNGNPYPASEAAPQHCGKPMTPLTYEQGVAATHTDAAHRLQWAAHGLHVYRRGGKRKWIPSVTVRQAEQAQKQCAGCLARREEARPPKQSVSKP